MATIRDPLPIGTITLRNRLALPPIAQARATPEGDPVEYHLAHYGRIARAGVGLVIVEHAFVDAGGRYSEGQVAVDADARIAALARLAESIRREGAAAALQISHAGPRLDDPNRAGLGPSAIKLPGGGEAPRELSISEVQALPERFAAAALRAVRAGFDAVEVHGAHGFLLSSFLSPLTNHRADSYGGSFAGRMRLHLEVVRAVRSAISGRAALLFRLGIEDRLPGGLTLEEGLRAATEIAGAGADALHISGGLCGSRPADLFGQGYFVPQAAAARRAVSVPVIGVGGITNAEAARRFVAEGLVDVVASGRHLVAHPEWAREVLA